MLYPLSYEGENSIVTRIVGTCKSIRKEAAEKPKVRGLLRGGAVRYTAYAIFSAIPKSNAKPRFRHDIAF